MKSARLLFIFFLTLQYGKSQNFISAESMAIVELFTSEGCSSCPAADELLKEMSDIRAKEGYPFIGLSFHITYWNRSGWIDSFSNEAYTDRQKMYQEKLKLPLLYTPQSIVNGEVEFVGSNPIAFRNALTNAEGQNSKYLILVNATKVNGGFILNYSLNREPKNEVINIAVIEKYRERKITRGENKSRTLKHYNVVRHFKTVDARMEDSIILDTLHSSLSEDIEVVLYIQNKKSLRILGAVKVEID
jgi:hypothetical protein